MSSASRRIDLTPLAEELRPLPDAGPVYQRIAARVRDEIEAGRLGPGDRLPTIRALARALGVNRDTVQLAYDALAREGRVESTVGRGTFVRSPAEAAPPAPF